ncbi:TlpA family protein disulfide reductase [Algibacter sp. L1A34]|uniref:TlpA family protein disulfide reductase n=1 Tax=Algibacter sp. L1A34 TaxID=2686365 RepID=UPI00131AB0CE|nr:TlpA disulfide reductase family protein [Algibacter sp. L1A34]
MKIALLSFITILITVCGFAQRITVEDAEFDDFYYKAENKPVIKGEVLNLTEEEIKNTKLEYSLVTPFAQNESQIKKHGTLNADGSFELEIDNSFPYQQIWLHVGKLFYAGVYANSDLLITLDADSLRTKRAYMNGPGVTYSGTDGAVNTVLNNHVLFKHKKKLSIGTAISTVRRNRNLDYDTYLSKTDSLYAILHKIDDQFIEKNPSSYDWMIKNERMSDYYGIICLKHRSSSTPKMDEKLFDKIKNHKPYLVSNDASSYYNYFFDYIERRAGKYDRLDLYDFKNNSKLTESARMDVLEYYQLKNEEKAKAKAFQPFDRTRTRELTKSLEAALNDTIVAFRTQKTIKFIDSLFNDSKADLLKLKLSSKDINEQRIIFETTLKTVNTEWCREKLEAGYVESLAKLKTIENILKEEKPFESDNNIGKPIAEMPFGAKLYKVDSGNGQALLSNIKSAFKGKALILDFWATWCAPCLSDMPYSKKLHDEFKDDSVEFVYLCTSSGSSMKKWQAKIAEFEIGGTHIFVESSIESDLMGLFSFSGFPSYAFIDAHGDYKPGAIKRMSHLDKEVVKKMISKKKK